MKAIKVYDLSRARNAEHYQLHSDILSALSEEFLTDSGLTALGEQYKSLFAVENECYLRNADYKETPEIEAADSRRDSLFLYVAQTITTGIRCPITATHDAAQRLSYVLKPYKNAPRLNYASNTASISDFLLKLQEPANSADVDTLGLSTAISALDAANKEFNTLYSGRSISVLSRSTSETMKTIRPKVDDMAKQLFSAINSLYQVNTLITKNADTEKTLSDVIDHINSLLTQLQMTLSRAGVGGKPHPQPDDKPLPDGPTDPDDGGDGEDPDPDDVLS